MLCIPACCYALHRAVLRCTVLLCVAACCSAFAACCSGCSVLFWLQGTLDREEMGKICHRFNIGDGHEGVIQVSHNVCCMVHVVCHTLYVAPCMLHLVRRVARRSARCASYLVVCYMPHVPRCVPRCCMLHAAVVCCMPLLYVACRCCMLHVARCMPHVSCRTLSGAKCASYGALYMAHGACPNGAFRMVHGGDGAWPMLSENGHKQSPSHADMCLPRLATSCNMSYCVATVARHAWPNLPPAVGVAGVA
jgi:hypothetical protein